MENITIPNEPMGVQRGKQITIYAFCEDDGYDWQPILERITSELAQANIQPSFTPPDCQLVPGSHYISYRNDGDEHDQTPGPRNSGYNPLNKVDCFAELNVNIRSDQPLILVWPGIEGEEILRPQG